LAPEHCTHCPGSHTGQLPCLASASTTARAWLLIEHPGPWGSPIEGIDLAGPVAGAMALARRHAVRVQLILRPRRRRATPPVQVYVGWSGPAAWLEGLELADPAELGDLDLEAVAAGQRPGFGAPLGENGENLFLVCTHGRHDACCARLGRPLVQALYDRFGGVVWETTHVGGHRYAANLVCLPHGLYYGDLSPADGLAAVAAYLRREVWLERYRGRAGLPEPAQAAEHFLRSHTRALGIDALTLESVTEAPVSEVIIRLGPERYRIGVTRAPLEACGPECTDRRATYVLRDLSLLSSRSGEPGLVRSA
jgi:Sucrase/ferredoxin-like